MTPDQLRDEMKIPKSSKRFLSDLIKDYNKTSDEVYLEVE